MFFSHFKLILIWPDTNMTVHMFLSTVATDLEKDSWSSFLSFAWNAIFYYNKVDSKMIIIYFF